MKFKDKPSSTSPRVTIERGNSNGNIYFDVYTEDESQYIGTINYINVVASDGEYDMVYSYSATEHTSDYNKALRILVERFYKTQ
jgi:hypothetical protein